MARACWRRARHSTDEKAFATRRSNCLSIWRAPVATAPASVEPFVQRHETLLVRHELGLAAAHRLRVPACLPSLLQRLLIDIGWQLQADPERHVRLIASMEKVVRALPLNRRASAEQRGGGNGGARRLASVAFSARDRLSRVVSLTRVHPDGLFQSCLPQIADFGANGSTPLQCCRYTGLEVIAVPWHRAMQQMSWTPLKSLPLDTPSIIDPSSQIVAAAIVAQAAVVDHEKPTRWPQTLRL